MAVVRCLITLHTADNNPTNFVTNTLYFDDDEDIATNAPLITAVLQDEYSTLDGYLGPSITQGDHEFEFYRMSDPTPRVPIYTEEWALDAAPTGSALPFECAACLSFQAVRVSGLPQARRRGRIYLGPFNTTANTNGVLTTGLQTGIADFGQGLLTASNAAAWTWVVYSGVTNTGVPVDNGWSDNAWDTQRRRGIEWTNREVFG